MSRLKRRAAGLVLGMVVAGAASSALAQDGAGRVVSLGGSITEIVYALGLEDRLVAVDTTSQYPAAAKAALPDVGYLRALSAEGVLSVEPDLILAEADAGPPETVALLREASVPVRTAPAEESADGVLAKIDFVADALEAGEAGAALAGTVRADLATILDATAMIEERQRVLFVLSAAGGRIMAGGEGTSAAAMIEMAGGTSAVTGFSGYKPLNDEAILAAAPDVIVTMDGGPHMRPAGGMLALPGLAGTPAARHGRLVVMDGLYLLGFGPRTAHAVHDLAHALYPDRDLPTLPARPWTDAAGSGAR